MKTFAYGHASHRDPRNAFARAAAQADAQRADGDGAPTLGWLYLTDHYAGDAQALLDAARTRWPSAAWVGAVGVGICSNAVEYFDEPALALMLCDLPRERFRVFSGTRPLPREGFASYVAQVHADPQTQELADLIGELSARTESGYLFGGLASSRSQALHIADGVFEGGLSGVAFDHEVRIVSRVTQGCQPIGAPRRIDEADRNVVVSLDKKPALDALLGDLDLTSLKGPQALRKLRSTLVGLSDAGAEPAQRGAFGPAVRVRHLIGLDLQQRAIAIADTVDVGQALTFCTRDPEAARRDLMRIGAEIRDELESSVVPAGAPAPLAADASDAFAEASPAIAGAVYVSCAGRGGPHFGAPSAELAIVRRALGDVPLVGFFAAGEIGHRHLYGYTGVLTAFAADQPA